MHIGQLNNYLLTRIGSPVGHDQYSDESQLDYESNLPNDCKAAAMFALVVPVKRHSLVCITAYLSEIKGPKNKRAEP